MPETLRSVVAKFYDEYMNNTPKKLKIVDAYLFYILLTGIFQFGYCCLVGTFPFNSFLAGFISTVGSFVIGGEPSKIHQCTYIKMKLMQCDTDMLCVYAFTFLSNKVVHSTSNW
jgi:hypothetical protein